MLLAEASPSKAQVDVVADLEDAVARGDAGQRDEAHQRRHRQRLAGNPQRDHAADQGQRDVAHDDEGEHRRAVAAVEHQEDHGERHQRQQGNQPRRLLLRLELAFQRVK
jgi:hypothetical protein